MPTSFSGCSYLVLQAKYDVFDKPGYARILLSIYANKSRHSYIYISFIFPQRPWNRTILRHYFLDFDEYPSTAKVARQAQRGDTRCTRHLPGSRPQGYPHCLPEFPAMAMGRFLLKTHTVFGTVWQAMDFCTWFRKNMHLKKQQQQNSSACFSKFLTRIYAATN
jgi:hypothetical protein